MDDAPQSIQPQPIQPAPQPQSSAETAQAPAASEPPKKMSKGLKIVLIILISCTALGAIAYFVFFGSLMGLSYKRLSDSQADTKRRNDYTTLSVNLSEYLSKNNAIPDGNLDTAKFIGNSSDPSGASYSIKVTSCGANNLNCPTTPSLNAGEILVIKGATCDGQVITAKSNSTKFTFAIAGYVSSPGLIYCSYSN